MVPKIDQMEYNNFYAVDRELYATLVYDLWRDPVETIQMMAIWIWLESMVMACPDLTRKILSLPSQYISKIGDEALFCWACIDNAALLFSASVQDFPLTNSLLMKEIPIEIFRMSRELSIAGINDVICRVCAPCFKDIWDGAIARNAHMESLQARSSTNNNNNHEEVVAPKRVEIQKDERTLFVTFSKGYPVTEWEVREFFTGLFGDCIESFYMQEVSIGEHPLFAKIVLSDTSYIHEVLSGGSKAKFTINGKHVWMRKFIPKR